MGESIDRPANEIGNVFSETSDQPVRERQLSGRSHNEFMIDGFPRSTIRWSLGTGNTFRSISDRLGGTFTVRIEQGQLPQDWLVAVVTEPDSEDHPGSGTGNPFSAISELEMVERTTPTVPLLGRPQLSGAIIEGLNSIDHQSSETGDTISSISDPLGSSSSSVFTPHPAMVEGTTGQMFGPTVELRSTVVTERAALLDPEDLDPEVSLHNSGRNTKSASKAILNVAAAEGMGLVTIKIANGNSSPEVVNVLLYAGISAATAYITSSVAIALESEGRAPWTSRLMSRIGRAAAACGFIFMMGTLLPKDLMPWIPFVIGGMIITTAFALAIWK